MNIVLPDPIDIPHTYKVMLQEMGAVVFEDLPGSPEEIVRRCKDAEIITANYIDITPEIINSLPALRYIIVPSAGYEWVAVDAAKRKNVKVLNCPDHNAQAVAEHAFALLFSLQRRVIQAQQSLINGEWLPVDFMGSELAGKTMGVIGHGKVGSRVAAIAKGLGMKVSYTNSKSTDQELNQMLRSSDVICICAPLNQTTNGMLSQDRLRLLKPNAVLINVARGAIVDQEALYQALKSQAIAGAGLDVFTGEPLTGKPSDQILALAALPNVVATPHIGYNTHESAESLGKELVQNLKDCLDGKPKNIVN